MSIDIEHALNGIKAELEGGEEDYCKLLAIKAIQQQQTEIVKLKKAVKKTCKWEVNEIPYPWVKTECNNSFDIDKETDYGYCRFCGGKTEVKSL